MSPRTRLVVVFVLLGLCIGCGGGGAPAGPIDPGPAPIVVSVTPSSPITESGEVISFTALADGPVDGYTWHFRNGAYPRLLTDAEPRVGLGTPGSYEGEVIVRRGTVQSLPFTFSYEVAAATPHLPVVGAVFPGGATIGAPNELVPFRAFATGGVESWNWDFGAGAIPSTTDIAIPLVNLGSEGTYTGMITATNAFGTSEPFPFTFTVFEGALPVITDITPQGVIQSYGNFQAFRASIRNGATRFDWNFEPSGTRRSTTEPVFAIDLNSFGACSGTVQAFNAAGASQIVAFAYEVQAHPQAPTVTGVTPVPPTFAGKTTETGAFTCTAEGLTPLPNSFHWRFNGPTFQSFDANVHPRMPAPGTYSGVVTARNFFGRSVPFTFNYAVDILLPYDIQVSQVGEGVAGTAMRFDVNSRGGVQQYSLNFNGAARPGSSTRRQWWTVLNDPGTYTGTVKLTNSWGETEERFDIPVTGDPQPRWQTHSLNIKPSDSRLAVAVQDDRPAIAFERNNSSIWLARARTANPASSTDWTRSRIVDFTSPRFDLAFDGDHPVLLTRAPSIAVANSVQPLDLDWSRSPLGLPQPDPGTGVALAERAGLLEAMVAAGGNLYHARALIALPRISTDWVVHRVRDAVGTDCPVELATVDGVPIFVVGTAANAWYGRASVAEPASEADWLTYEVRGSPGSVEPALSIVDGRPIVALPRLSGPLRVSQALIANPQSTSDWAWHTVKWGSSERADIVDVNGSPLVLMSYREAGYCLHSRRAVSASPALVEDWSNSLVWPASIGFDILDLPEGPSLAHITFDQTNISSFPLQDILFTSSLGGL